MRTLVALFLVIVVLALRADVCLSGEEKDHICFNLVDVDKDGMVTLEEFEKHFGSDTERFELADLDKDGKLSHDEYHAFLGHGAS